MISNFSIQNLAIINTLDQSFNNGLTVLTGETGAGKSILVDALNLALGQRSDSQLVRHGQPQADIALHVDISYLPHAKQWLIDADIAHQDTEECLLRRVIKANGTSKAWINNSAVTLTQLQNFASQLVTVHSQNAHQQLLKLEVQCTLMDTFGNLNTRSVLNAYTAYKNALQAKDNITDIDNLNLRIAQLQDCIQDLETLEPKQGEWESLCEQQTQFAHVEQLSIFCRDCLQELDNGDGINKTVQKHQYTATNLSTYFPQIEAVAQLLESASINIDEAMSAINTLQKDDLFDAQLAHQIEERMRAWHDLARKHRVEPNALYQYWIDCQNEHEQLMRCIGDAEHIEQTVTQAEQAYRCAALQLSTERTQCAQRLQDRINTLLHTLDLRAGFSIEIVHHAQNKPAARGSDTVTFFFQPNAGIPPKPLHKIASGGELSRLSLALAVVLADAAHQPTLIFDEVDVGVGGATAETVGRLLKKLSTGSQILSITHQAHVAAFADQHLVVQKTQHNNTTQNCLRQLDMHERQTEIARMIGGVEQTEQALSHAQALLKNAQTTVAP